MAVPRCVNHPAALAAEGYDPERPLCYACQMEGPGVAGGERRWTIYVCERCGYMSGDERRDNQRDLDCGGCVMRPVEVVEAIASGPHDAGLTREELLELENGLGYVLRALSPRALQPADLQVPHDVAKAQLAIVRAALRGPGEPPEEEGDPYAGTWPHDEPQPDKDV